MKQSLRAATALAAFARRSASRPAPPSHGLLERIGRLGLAILRARATSAHPARASLEGRRRRGLV